MAIEARRIPGAHGVTVEHVINTAFEVIDRVMQENGLLEKANPSGADLMPFQSDVNRGVHQAIHDLPHDVWVRIGSAVTSEERPGWWHIVVDVEQRTTLGQGSYELV